MKLVIEIDTLELRLETEFCMEIGIETTIEELNEIIADIDEDYAEEYRQNRTCDTTGFCGGMSCPQYFECNS